MVLNKFKQTINKKKEKYYGVFCISHRGGVSDLLYDVTPTNYQILPTFQQDVVDKFDEYDLFLISHTIGSGTFGYIFVPQFLINQGTGISLGHVEAGTVGVDTYVSKSDDGWKISNTMAQYSHNIKIYGVKLK